MSSPPSLGPGEIEPAATDGAKELLCKRGSGEGLRLRHGAGGCFTPLGAGEELDRQVTAEEPLRKHTLEFTLGGELVFPAGGSSSVEVSFGSVPLGEAIQKKGLVFLLPSSSSLP
eukprot:RCo052825